MLSVVQAEAGWFGEGDDLFHVDGEEKPSIEGTGSEDHFDDAWGPTWTTARTPGCRWRRPPASGLA